MMRVGENGYITSCHSIVGATKRIIDTITTDPLLSTELRILGKPLVSVVAFEAKKEGDLDIYDVADGMSAKGWHLNALQNPAAIHVAVTLPIVAAVEDLIKDLREVVLEEREKEDERVKKGGSTGKKKKGDAAALYGVAGSLPDKSVVVELAEGFLDCLYKA